VAELAVYLHIPFCERKCPYCAFISYTSDSQTKTEYLNAVAKEFAVWQKKVGKITATTVYIGGGTPSCLSLENWEALAQTLENYIDFSKCAEFTVEANPNSLTRELLEFWKHWRVTRVSIGVQSLDDKELNFLGRLHNSSAALNAIEMAKGVGFDVSADFMFGLPGQTFDKWKTTLEKVIALDISHISLYQLSIEEGTAFEKEDFVLPEGEKEYTFAQQYLQEKDFIQYEIANFAHAGKESKHNLNYWRGGDYLGIGAAASGYIDGVRYTNEAGLEKYCNSVISGRDAIAFAEKLDMFAKAREASVLRLRMSEGIDRKSYCNEFGKKCERYVIETLKKFPKELYEITEKKIALTQAGMCVANRIWVELV